MSVTKRVFLTFLILGAWSTQPVLAQQAEVACKSTYGGVKIRSGKCNYGEELVKVMDSSSTNGNRSSTGEPAEIRAFECW